LHGAFASGGGGSTGAPSGLMQNTWPVTGLISAVSHFGGVPCSDVSAPAAEIDAATNRTPVKTRNIVIGSAFRSPQLRLVIPAKAGIQ
jgi:hypothetical protein